MTEFNQGFARIKTLKECDFRVNERGVKAKRHNCVKISILIGRVIPRAADALCRPLSGYPLLEGAIRRDGQLCGRSHALISGHSSVAHVVAQIRSAIKTAALPQSLARRDNS